MKILFTGASSFTGYWFVKALCEAGHQVVAPLRGSLSSYREGPRALRVAKLPALCEVVEECALGSARFSDLSRQKGFDLFCHHAARVEGYKSPEFDAVSALSENTSGLKSALESLSKGGLQGVLLTGSVFEGHEGAGTPPLLPFSPYGLSKELTAEVVSYYSHALGLSYGKFVIPNPFGPLEEPRFCAYLVKNWKAGLPAHVNTPDYIRDNIHVDLLAQSYAKFAQDLHLKGGRLKLNPSGYVESQGQFALRFAKEMRKRTTLECALELPVQRDFSEPLMRVNTESASLYAPHWDETAAWDNYISTLSEST